MPATDREIIEYAIGLFDAGMPDAVAAMMDGLHPYPVWQDGTRATYEEVGLLDRVVLYEFDRRRDLARRPARLRAMRLLRSFLDDDQRRQLRQSHCFDHVAPSGARYRFFPLGGGVEVVERRGKRWRCVRRFCIHPKDSREIPPADTTLAQLLTLVESEANFLATAHYRDIPGSEPGWQRHRIRRRRIEHQIDAELAAAGLGRPTGLAWWDLLDARFAAAGFPRYLRPADTLWYDSEGRVLPGQEG